MYLGSFDIIALAVLVLFVIIIFTRNIYTSLDFSTRMTLRHSQPSLVNLPYATFLVLFAKAINRLDIIEKYYEDKLAMFCKILINTATFKENDERYNKALITEAYRMATVEIILFGDLRKKIINDNLPHAIRKVEWHIKNIS